jgi:SAM-dependent methyltransferase
VPQLVSTVAVAGPLSLSVGRARCTCFGAGTETALHPAGMVTLEVFPPPPPQPTSRIDASVVAAAVRPTLKAPKPTPGACDDRDMEAGPDPAPPSRRILLTGRAISALIAHAPFAWPLLRGFSHRYWQERAASWDQRVGRSGPTHLAPLAAALLHVRPEPERALDIGTGLGDGALLIAREFPRARVRGVDLSEEMVRRAQERIGLDPEGRVAFKVGDASKLVFEDDSFDLVAQLNMPPFFAEISRVLRPGGFAIVAATWGERTPFYTPESVLERGFRKAGLEKVESGEAAEGTYFVARRPS